MSQGKYRVLHLCEKCAEQEEGGSHKTELNVEQMIQEIVLAAVGHELPRDLAKLTCPYCGTKYGEFHTLGQLGCPADYEAFHTGLLPLLQRIHGSTEHSGKCPRRVSRPQAELIRLRRELRSAVELEDFEEAARLRDLIRAKEPRHEPQ
jgi:protein arginine kinase activator